MTEDNRAHLLNSRLLALYLKVAAQGAARDEAKVQAEIKAIRAGLQPQNDGALAEIFDRYVRLIGLHLTAPGKAGLDRALGQPVQDGPANAAIPPAFLNVDGELGPLTPHGLPGVSLVTCSMNRSQNLLRVLPSWLAIAEISEVVIVDWSSDRPVADELAEAGMVDPRIRILRVEGEPRWVLSYAFNAGFRAAACERILKADADILLAPDFIQRNPLLPDAFVAGNWQQAAADQAHVNGFFYIHRKALYQVSGFNEHITTYGWDDDDLYDRLILSGLRRQDVAPGTIHHLDHEDDERLGGAAGISGAPSLRQEVMTGTRFLIRRNRYIAAVMPPWEKGAILLPFLVIDRSANVLRLRRQGWVPSLVPDHVKRAADLHAQIEMSSWRLSRRLLLVDPQNIDLILNRPAADVSRIDVEIALSQPEYVLRGPGRYLLLEIQGGVLDAPERIPGLSEGLIRLIQAARARGLHPVLRAPHVKLPLTSPGCLRMIPLIPLWEPVGEVAEISADALMSNRSALTNDLRMPLRVEDITTLGLSAPDVSIRRPKFFIDAQHGLGNRLRAMGSAAALAEASGRELVVVWQSDDHCDAKLSDLFDYDGAVEETRFLETAAAKGSDVYNYITIEPGAVKDAPIRLDGSADIYVRSASVLNAPASIWEEENRFLQALSPIRKIRDLVADVRHPNDLSVHVRMEGGKKHEHLAYEKPENWSAEDHALIDEWRGKSHYRHFLQRIDALLSEGKVKSLFLAADMPETYDVFHDRYGDRLAFLPRSVFDRSAEQMHFALADAILLSRAPRLLGSTWSSFSELAMRLSPAPMAIEMSGKDF